MFNNLNLRATRRSLLFSAEQISRLCPSPKGKGTGEPMSERYYRHLEQAERPISPETEQVFQEQALSYTRLLELLLLDIEKFKIKQGVDTPFTIPYFYHFADFIRATKNNDRACYNIWQACIGHLTVIGKIDVLDDNSTIPNHYHCWQWLKKPIYRIQSL